MKTDDRQRCGLAARLQAVAEMAPQTGITLGVLRSQLADSAYGGMLAVLALPCCLPFVYILPQIVAVPMVLIALQMTMGKPVPWLPGSLASRVMSRDELLRLVERTGPALQRIETICKPRLNLLSGARARTGVGALLLLFALCVLVPVPGTNTVPGIAILIVALGMIERDGLVMAAGLMLGLSWVAALAGLVVLGVWAIGGV